MTGHTHPSYWKPPIGAKERKSHGCLHCEAAGTIGITFRPDQIIAVGFGSACLTRDGVAVYSEPQWNGEGDEPGDSAYMTGAGAEDMAVTDPDHDWRIEIYGPLSGRTYQRQGAANWVLIEQNEGFA